MEGYLYEKRKEERRKAKTMQTKANKVESLNKVGLRNDKAMVSREIF